MAEILTAVERQQAIQRAVDGWGEMDCRYGDREEIIAEEVERAVVSRLAAMGGELPPLPATDWLLHMPAQQDMRDYGRAALARGVAAGTAAERERNAERAVAIGHLSQVNALRAERDALLRRREELQTDLACAVARIAAERSDRDTLVAERDALAADARRYRWMRDNQRGRTLSISAIEWTGDADKADTAIDALAAKEQSNG
jgi:hypothetical protein